MSAATALTPAHTTMQGKFRLLWHLVAILVLVGIATLLVSGRLTESTLQAAQQDAFQDRFAFTAQRAATAAENALAMRIPLASDAPLAELLRREAGLEPLIQSFEITSAQGQSLLAAPISRVNSQGGADAPGEITSAIHNDLGETVATVRLRYNVARLHAAQEGLHQVVWHTAWLAVALWSAMMGGLCWRLARPGPASASRFATLGGKRVLLTLAAALGLGVALVGVGWRATVAGQAGIEPDQVAKAQVIARSSASLVEHALELGVPLHQLVGLQEHTAALQAGSPEILGLALRAADGTTLAGQAPPPHAKTVVAPVSHQGSTQAEVVLTLDPGVLARKVRARLLDMAILAAVCLLMAMEAVALGLGTRGARALAAWEARANRLAKRHVLRPGKSATAMRPALFLFMLAEEFTRPFLPTWARTLAPQDWALSPDALASLPLVLFMAMVALLQWPLAAWSERFGRRRGMVLGAVLGAAGLGLPGVVPEYGALLGGRLLGAVGFAMVFVSAQGATIDGSARHDRARSMAQFVRAILVAGLCGPSLGGMAADQWGPQITFALAACIALLAALIALRQMPREPSLKGSTAAMLSDDQAWKTLPHQPGLTGLLLGCAFPAKLLLTALCFFLLPMHLRDAGYDNAEIGRLQTIYPLVMVLMVSAAARVADHLGRREWFVVLGGLLAGGSALAAGWGPGGLWALSLVLLCLGLGQAISITPQSALVADWARALPGRQGAATLGLFRLTERTGSALGPAVAAALLPLVGFGSAVALIGALVFGGSLAYGWNQRSLARAGA